MRCSFPYRNEAAFVVCFDLHLNASSITTGEALALTHETTRSSSVQASFVKCNVQDASEIEVIGPAYHP